MNPQVKANRNPNGTLVSISPAPTGRSRCCQARGSGVAGQNQVGTHLPIGLMVFRRRHEHFRRRKQRRTDKTARQRVRPPGAPSRLRADHPGRDSRAAGLGTEPHTTVIDSANAGPPTLFPWQKIYYDTTAGVPSRYYDRPIVAAQVLLPQRGPPVYRALRKLRYLPPVWAWASCTRDGPTPSPRLRPATVAQRLCPSRDLR